MFKFNTHEAKTAVCQCLTKSLSVKVLGSLSTRRRCVRKEQAVLTGPPPAVGGWVGLAKPSCALGTSGALREQPIWRCTERPLVQPTPSSPSPQSGGFCGFGNQKTTKTPRVRTHSVAGAHGMFKALVACTHNAGMQTQRRQAPIKNPSKNSRPSVVVCNIVQEARKRGSQNCHWIPTTCSRAIVRCHMGPDGTLYISWGHS